MRGTIRWSLAAATMAMAMTLAPAGASAAKETCIFDDLEASDRNLERVERSLFCLTNLHRLRSGVPALSLDTRLAAAARAHSADMVARGYFDHESPEGTQPSDRAAAAGYPFGAGENIAGAVTGTAREMFELWLSSPPHNAGMLGTGTPAAGMGISLGCCPGFGAVGDGITGTQLFGLGPADTSDDALDFYASSGKCVKVKEKLFRKRDARTRARKSKRRRLGGQIRDLKRDVRKRCKELRRS